MPEEGEGSCQDLRPAKAAKAKEKKSKKRRIRRRSRRDGPAAVVAPTTVVASAAYSSFSPPIPQINLETNDWAVRSRGDPQKLVAVVARHDGRQDLLAATLAWSQA